MFAATFYDVYKNWALLKFDDLGMFSVGFVVAFISAFWAVKGLLYYVAHHNFNAFAWYRLLFGTIVLIYFW
jgi:undecaprenyl-diphosphatase